MLWFVRQSLVLLVLAWALGLATGFLLFGRRRGWAEPYTDVIPVIAADEDDADGAWVDEGWVAADADADLRATVDPDGAPARWGPVGDDWDAVPAHHDYADPVWAAEAGITDDVLARQVDAADGSPAAADPAADQVGPVADPATRPAPAGPTAPVDPFVRPLPTAAEPVPVPRPAVPGPAAARTPEPTAERVEPRVVAPRPVVDGADDLTRIDGVTPEIAAALHASGLRTFTAVARSTTGDLRAALSAAGLAPTFKAAYWPLIAGDLVHAALAEAEAAEAAGAGAAADAEAAAVVGPAAEVTVDETDEGTAERPVEDVTGSEDDAADASAPSDDPVGADTSATVDVTDAATSPVDVTDAAVDAAAGTVVDTVGAAYRLDDLERVDGITLKMAVALRDAGITSFTDLADAPHAQLRQALTAAGLRIPPSLQTWGTQARRLAAESDAALAARITAGGPGARL